MNKQTERNLKMAFPFMGVLTLLFVAAKLFGFIDWSWWWVFSPLWIEAAFVVILLIAFVIGYWVFYKLFE